MYRPWNRKTVLTAIIFVSAPGITVNGEAITQTVLEKIAFGSKQAHGFMHRKRNGLTTGSKVLATENLTRPTVFKQAAKPMETYETWPPKDAVKKRLYANANGTCDFSKPTAPTGFVSYISDPKKSQYPTAHNP